MNSRINALILFNTELLIEKEQKDNTVEIECTDILKILRGYYKEVNGKITENFERSKSKNIRVGTLWVDIQQVFYRIIGKNFSKMELKNE